MARPKNQHRASDPASSRDKAKKRAAPEGHAELDRAIAELDGLLERGPGEDFEGTLKGINDRIDAAGGTGSSTAKKARSTQECSTGGHSGPGALRRIKPKAIARAKCRVTESNDFDAAPVCEEDLGAQWTSAFLVHQERQERNEAAEATAQEAAPAPVQSDLEDEVLRDLLELDQIGAGVAWPNGLDARIARLVLNDRMARARAALSAEARTAAVEGSNDSSSSTSSSSSCSSSSESKEPQPKRQRTRKCEGAQARPEGTS